MNNRFYKALIFILELATAILTLTFCVQGYLLSEFNSDYYYQFIESGARCILTVVFAFFYYFSFSRNFGSSGFFMPLYLLFNLIAELKICEKLSYLSKSIIIPPDILICLFLFSNFMMATSLIGYGIFFDVQNQKPAKEYFFISSAVCILLFYALPKPITILQIWDVTATCIISISAFAICVLVFIILLITENQQTDHIRSLAAIMLITSSFINLFYDTFIMNIIGTLFFIVGCITIIIVSKINEVTL